MLFHFPKPKTKKTVWLTLDNGIWSGIEKIMKDQGITQEQVINTIITEAWYKPDYTVDQNEKQEIKLVQAASDLPAQNPDQVEKLGQAILQYSEKSPKQTRGFAKGIFKKLDANHWGGKCSQCKKCGTKDKKHIGQGLCSYCYWKFREKNFKRSAPAEVIPDKSTADPQTLNPYKICQECGARYYKKPNVSQKLFEASKFHSKECRIQNNYNKPRIKTEYQKKIEEKAKKDDQHMKDMIIICECPNKEKIVKGCEKVYKQHIFYADYCMEWFINNKEGKKDSIMDLFDEDPEVPARELNLNTDALKTY